MEKYKIIYEKNNIEKMDTYPTLTQAEEYYNKLIANLKEYESATLTEVLALQSHNKPKISWEMRLLLMDKRIREGEHTGGFYIYYHKGKETHFTTSAELEEAMWMYQQKVDEDIYTSVELLEMIDSYIEIPKDFKPNNIE